LLILRLNSSNTWVIGFDIIEDTFSDTAHTRSTTDVAGKDAKQGLFDRMNP